MTAGDAAGIDVLIVGGGAAGLWTLDELQRSGYNAWLVEHDALGIGQTIASQGIIHGGLKYTLAGLLNESAETIRDMPALWRGCLAGSNQPDLRRTPVLSECCYLWRTTSVASKVGLVGARAGLRTAAIKIDRTDRPVALASCPGDVFRIDEQVIDPAGLLRDLADRQGERILRCDASAGVQFSCDGPGRVELVTLTHPQTGQHLQIRPRCIVLTAGAGNADLRERAGLTASVMQRRPLHMVLVRGDLPALFGHCVDGAKTRVTIITTSDEQDRRVWLVGGQVSEDGVDMAPGDLIAHARTELTQALPGFDLQDVEWATLRVDRAEAKTRGRARPAGPFATRDERVITAWPTKLALVPQLAKLIRGLLGEPSAKESRSTAAPRDWPRPEVAPPPWDEDRRWVRLS